MLGGRGEFAIPYLHVRDAVQLVRKIIKLADELESGDVFLACPDGGVTSRSLFEQATLLYFGSAEEPIWVPRWFCRLGMRMREKLLTLLGRPPFERAWMADYIDRQLLVDARRTRQTLGWEPRARLSIERRLPFMIENLKTNPAEWYRRNHAAMRLEPPLENLRIHRLLEKHETRILEGVFTLMTNPEGRERFPGYQALPPEEQMWYHRVAFRHLLDSVRTRDKSIFASFCRDMAELRCGQGFMVEEVCEAVRALRDFCIRVVDEDPDSEGLSQVIEDHVAMTMLCGCDQIEDTFERFEEVGDHWKANRDRVAAEIEEPTIANEPQ